MRRIIYFILLSTRIYAYEDSDLDGVEDAYDQCPDTSLTELVDISGCSIRSLVNHHHYDMIFGGSFSQIDYKTNELTDTYNTEFQFDYYYKNFSFQAVISYFTSSSESYSNNGLNDTVLAVYYQFFPASSLGLRLGTGVILPTYESGLGNEAADYMLSANLNYAFNAFSFFGGYGYTMINDSDVENSVSYQNTHALNAGAGTDLTSNLYGSISYFYSDSIYSDIEAIQNISLYTFYRFDPYWFGIANYAYGLSDSTSNHFLSLKIGYYF